MIRTVAFAFALLIIASCSPLSSDQIIQVLSAVNSFREKAVNGELVFQTKLSPLGNLRQVAWSQTLVDKIEASLQQCKFYSTQTTEPEYSYQLSLLDAQSVPVSQLDMQTVVYQQLVAGQATFQHSDFFRLKNRDPLQNFLAQTLAQINTEIGCASVTCISDLQQQQTLFECLYNSKAPLNSALYPRFTRFFYSSNYWNIGIEFKQTEIDQILAKLNSKRALINSGTLRQNDSPSAQGQTWPKPIVPLKNLKWCPISAKLALYWAAQCKSTSRPEGERLINRVQYGENIFVTESLNIDAAIDEWFSYGMIPEAINPADRLIFQSNILVGNFAQIIWQQTATVGCAAAFCPEGLDGLPGAKSVFVCDFGPTGNVQGRAIYI